MQELLSTLIGRQIQIACSGASGFRGECVKVAAGVLHLKDEEGEVCYISIDKIVAVWEKKERDRHPGFVFKS
ncbi:MAG TPA: MM0924 family protein [Pyrinomonadaceae bacterium]|nr:MM0924 family protein [Pyrinomonadaceae bacterium]